MLVDRTGWISISIELRTASGSTDSAGGCPRNGGLNHHIIAHEFGHAMGFPHTRNQFGVMNTLGPPSAGACNAEPSAMERFHAAVVYSRPPGNTDIDVDPPGFVIPVGH